jgi:hypothetical protein
VRVDVLHCNQKRKTMSTKPKYKPLTAEEITGTTPLDMLDDSQLDAVSREFQAGGGKWHFKASQFCVWLQSTTKRDNCHILPKGCTLDDGISLAKQQRR